MTTAQLALALSLVSVLVAATSLGWNIYRDVLLKARIRVSFAIKLIFHTGTEPLGPFIGITATNHGPGVVKLNTIILKHSSLIRKAFRSESYAVLMHDYENRYSGSLPATLNVGDSIDLLVKYDAECLLKDSFNQLGITDSFGRVHWASKRDMKIAKTKWLDEFQVGSGDV